MGSKPFITPLLGELTLEIGEDQYKLDLDSIVPITADLSDEFARQPSLYAFVAMLSAQAEALWIQAKQDTERVKARTDKEIRYKANVNREKITENFISNLVLMDEKVQEAEAFEADSRYQYMLMKVITQSMDQRAQMLISLGAHLRSEADMTGMIIRDAKTRLEAVKALSTASKQDGKR